MTFLDLYREKYQRCGGSGEQFVEAYRHADPEKVVDYRASRLMRTRSVGVSPTEGRASPS